MDRIDAVCSLIEPCDSLADIGCDHGRVALYALENGVKRVIAADISAGSLKKAQALLCGRPGAETVLSDGFDAIEQRVDCAVIAGMGGLKIVEILSRIDYRPTLILGAQHNIDKLRRYLTENGYRIERDTWLYDRGKFYAFIRAREGSSPPLTELQLVYGVYYKEKNESLKLFATEQMKKLRTYKQTEENKKLLALTEEVLKWQE